MKKPITTIERLRKLMLEKPEVPTPEELAQIARTTRRFEEIFANDEKYVEAGAHSESIVTGRALSVGATYVDRLKAIAYTIALKYRMPPEDVLKLPIRHMLAFIEDAAREKIGPALKQSASRATIDRTDAAILHLLAQHVGRRMQLAEIADLATGDVPRDTTTLSKRLRRMAEGGLVFAPRPRSQDGYTITDAGIAMIRKK